MARSTPGVLAAALERTAAPVSRRAPGRRHAVGRPRLTNCFAEHVVGTECRPCRVERQGRYRKKKQRLAVAGAAGFLEHNSVSSRVRRKSHEEQLADRARAYVWTYVRRGRIRIPECCEVCGAPGKLVFWHPDVVRPRDVLWCCSRDRARISATLEPVVLTWVWPGADKRRDPISVTSIRSPRGTRTKDREQRVVPPPEPVAAPCDTKPRCPADRNAAEAWLVVLEPSLAESYRVAASTVSGFRMSRESPLYNQRLIQLFIRYGS